MYEIGSLRLKLYPTTTYFEIIDGHKRLSTYLNTIDQIPSLMTLLIQTLMDEVLKYQEQIEKLVEHEKKDLKEYEETYEKKRKEDYPEDYLRRIEVYIEKARGKVEVYEKLINTCTRLVKELDKCYSLLINFMDLRSKL